MGPGMRGMFDAEDPGARRNRGDQGLWVINALVSTIVLLLSLYVFQPRQSRETAQAALSAVEALPGQLGPSTAQAADRD